MNKIMTFITIIGLLFISSNVMGDEFLSANVINAQAQNQVSVLIPVGNGTTISVGIQMQKQIGSGISDIYSVAGDRQSQNSTTNDSTLSSTTAGLSNGGNYRYMNGQAAISVDTTLVGIDTTQDVSGVVGGMGAITQSTGSAVATAGGVLENNGWSMSNQANSLVKPVSVNVDGFIQY